MLTKIEWYPQNHKALWSPVAFEFGVGQPEKIQQNIYHQFCTRPVDEVIEFILSLSYQPPNDRAKMVKTASGVRVYTERAVYNIDSNQTIRVTGELATLYGIVVNLEDSQPANQIDVTTLDGHRLLRADAVQQWLHDIAVRDIKECAEKLYGVVGARIFHVADHKLEDIKEQYLRIRLLRISEQLVSAVRSLPVVLSELENFNEERRWQLEKEANNDA